MNTKIEIDNEKIYNGCLNTFVIARYKDNMDVGYNAIKYCNKYGCDGLILLDTFNNKPNTIFKMIFYNRDGTNGYMCGNGIRCLIRYAYEENLLKANAIYKIDTFTGIKECIITSISPFIVKVNLGLPSYDPTDVELNDSIEYFNRDLEVASKSVKISCLFLTTHHAVVLLKSKDELEEIKKQKLGELIKDHPIFKKGINVNFVYVIDKDNIFLQTCERGVGYTLACGTGASSSFAVLRRMGKVNDKVIAHFIHGSVNVYENQKHEIILEGRADKGKQ